MFETYRPSGRISPLVLPWLAVALLVVVASAYVYQLGLYWIPIIYVNFLLTLGMGLLVGITVSLVVKNGKVRNTFASYVILLFLGAMAVVAKFGFQYMQARIDFEKALQGVQFEELQGENGEKLPPEAMGEVRQMLLDDYTFLNHLQQRVDNGWEINNAGGGNGGNPVSGLFVHLIWAIEAGTILYMGNKARQVAAKLPFSERVGVWADENEVVMLLPVTSAEMVAKIEAARSVNELLDLPVPSSDHSDQIAVYTVHSVPGDEMEDAYLTVELQTHRVNAKGENETISKPLVRNAVLTTAQRIHLKENADIIKEAFAAYHASLIGKPEPDSPLDSSGAVS